MAEQASQDWIKHDGAGCPVSDLARVQVQFRADRDRRAAERLSGEQGNVANAYSDSWAFPTTSDCSVDIVAYRVVA